jgi:hypothetical protein
MRNVSALHLQYAAAPRPREYAGDEGRLNSRTSPTVTPGPVVKFDRNNDGVGCQ